MFPAAFRAPECLARAALWEGFAGSTWCKASEFLCLPSSTLGLRQLEVSPHEGTRTVLEAIEGEAFIPWLHAGIFLGLSEDALVQKELQRLRALGRVAVQFCKQC